MSAKAPDFRPPKWQSARVVSTSAPGDYLHIYLIENNTANQPPNPPQVMSMLARVWVKFCFHARCVFHFTLNLFRIGKNRLSEKLFFRIKARYCVFFPVQLCVFWLWLCFVVLWSCVGVCAILFNCQILDCVGGNIL